MKHLFAFILVLSFYQAHAQVISVTIDAKSELSRISPYIYGRNNNVSDDPAKPVSASTWQKYKDAGLKMYRENAGNNATKYNYKLKLSSHPDWYNNVYAHDWDYSAKSILNNTQNTQVMYAFQLLGKVASNNKNNFNDWAYNQSQWWSGVSNNWAGGGGPNTGNGNPDLYLKAWPADSTTEIVKYWADNLKLDTSRLRYWNMDNEPEIWSSTHDDIAGKPSAEDFIQKYIAVAKLARKKFPGIKLTGPVSPNEWQWFNWNDAKVTDTKTGKEYSWIEYFIKRISEEQTASGVRLLDVIDFHFYPGTQNNPDLTLQLHRIWFDMNWDYPNANGVKRVGPSGWNAGVTKEYVFERCRQWLDQYFGAGHGIKLGVSEYGEITNNDANVVACWYASHLGVFANKGVEYFTPWDWYIGQWEVMHLFSNYYGTRAVAASSTSEDVVSAYSSLSEKGDSLMIAIVNRDRTNSRTLDITLQNFIPSATTVNGFQLANLPSTETFVSKNNNALQKKQFTISSNHINVTVPKLSVTLIQIPTENLVTGLKQEVENSLNIYPNPGKDMVHLQLKNKGPFSVEILDLLGRSIEKSDFKDETPFNTSHLAPGSYIFSVTQGIESWKVRWVKE